MQLKHQPGSQRKASGPLSLKLKYQPGPQLLHLVAKLLAALSTVTFIIISQSHCVPC